MDPNYRRRSQQEDEFARSPPLLGIYDTKRQCDFVLGGPLLGLFLARARSERAVVEAPRSVVSRQEIFQEVGLDVSFPVKREA